MQWRQLSRSEWFEMWRELPPTHRDVYSHPGYHDVCAAWTGGQPEYLTIHNGRGHALYAFLRRPIEGFVTSGRRIFDTETCYGYGGPIFCGEWTSEDRVAALAAIRDHLGVTDVIAEFVRCRPIGLHPSELAAGDYRVVQVRTNVEYELPADGLEAVPGAWHKKARRDVRRALRAGLDYAVDGDARHVAEFDMLYQMTAERLNMAPFYRFDLAHFAGLLSVEPDLVKLIRVHHKESGQCLSAGILFLGGETAHYHLGASNLAYRAVCPNDFLFFALARVAAEHGMRRIVWGGGLSNAPDDTLRKFKERFGTHLVPVHIACRVIDPGMYESLCAQWELRHPQNTETPRLFLRYRQ